MTALAAEARPAEANPRVLLTVTGGPASTTLPVVRVALDGSVDVLPERLRTDASGRGTTSDYRAPFGVPVFYRTVEATGEGQSARVVLDVRVPWLVHPFSPSLSMPIAGDGLRVPTFGADSFSSTTRPSSTSVIEPLGRDDPIAIRTGRRRGRSSQMVVRTRTSEQTAAFVELLEDDSPLLLNVHPGLGWGVETSWVQVGDVEEARRPTVVTDETRVWSLPYRVVAEPVGTVQSDWTFITAQQVAPTFIAASQVWQTFADAELDVRRGA